MNHFPLWKYFFIVLALFGSGCQEARGWSLLRFDPRVDGLQPGWLSLSLVGCRCDTGLDESADPAKAIDTRTTVLQPVFTAVPGSVLYTYKGTSRISHEHLMDSQVNYRLVVAVQDQHATGFFSVDPSAIPQHHYRVRGDLGAGRINLELSAIEPTAHSAATVSGIELLVGSCAGTKQFASR